MDSRVFPTQFTAPTIGDLFIVRNEGNFVPHARKLEKGSGMFSTEVGAMELACVRGAAGSIVVCGHSDCRASLIFFRMYYTEFTKKA